MLIIKRGNSDTKSLLERSYCLFESGDFVSAQSVLDEAHAVDYENPEIRAALRACGFWTQRVKSLDFFTEDGTRGDYLRRQWQVFEERYRPGLEHPFDEGSSRIKTWVHTRALEDYSSLSKAAPDVQALLQTGRCLKALGRYTDVIGTLQEALRITVYPDSRLLAELADVYALIGETRIAKVMFREALFQGAGKIELDEIHAPLFRRLIERLRGVWDAEKEGFPEWLPVYGVIWGVLDVRRELNPVEFGKLKQSIYALKSEIADGDDGGLLVPRLINRYFRLIDHYQITGSDRTTIDEALMNIKLLSSSIHRLYTE